MKHLLLLLLFSIGFNQVHAQFFQAFGEPGQNIQATQIRVLNGNTYVAGFWSTAGLAASGNTEQGLIFRLDPNGDLDWVYQLDSQTPAGTVNGTRIYDFTFSDSEDEIVFVGGTNLRLNPAAGAFLDNECIVGMIETTTGNPIFQQAFDFRNTARELFLRIVNDPDPSIPDSYFISGTINDMNTGPGTIDSYVGAQAIISNFNAPFVVFPWINEYDYPLQATPDQEIFRMEVVDVAGNSEIVFGGVDNPSVTPGNGSNNARLNFHDTGGNILGEFAFNQSGSVLDVVQTGNTLVVVGQLRANIGAAGRPFITCIDLPSRTVITNSLSFPVAQMDRFSRVSIDPVSQDILVIGERLGQNSVICRFELAGNTLNYINNVVLAFGTDGTGTGLLEFENNEAYWADSRLGFNLPLNPTEQAVAVVRTDPNFETCETRSIFLSPNDEDMQLDQMMGITVTPLMAPPVDLDNVAANLCTVNMCGSNTVGINFSNLVQVPHGADGEYVTVADVDQDNWLDFAIPDRRYGTSPRFTIAQNTQNLTFNGLPSNGFSQPFNGAGESIDFIQLDGTGDLDLILHRQPIIEIFLVNNGIYNLVQTLDATILALPNPGNTVGIYRSDFDLVDYDNDGNDDLVVTGSEIGGGSSTIPRIVIFAGTGNPSAPFTTNPVVSLAGLPSISYWETKHLDIDGVDGPDLLIGQAGYDGSTQSIFGYLSTSSNSFNMPATPNLNYETPSGFIWPRGMEMVNIDGNPQLDLITAVQAEQLISNTPSGNGALLIARNVPTIAGNYTAASLQWQVLNIPGQPVGIDVGDLDHDGDQDIVVAVHFPTSFVRVYENNGNGNFFNFVDYATPGGRTTEVQIADFDNDCCMDIVTSQWGAQFSYILSNDCENSEFVIEGTVRCEDNPCLFGGDPAPNQLVSATIGNVTYFALTDVGGNYVIQVPSGSYDVALVNGNYGNPACNANTNVFTNDVIGVTPNTTATVNFAMNDTCLLEVNMIGSIIGSVGTNDCPYVATPCEDLIWEYCFEIENNTCTDRTINQVTIDLPHGIDINFVVVNPIFECGTQNQVSTGTPFVASVTNSTLFSAVANYNLAPAITIPAGGCFSGCVQATFTGGFTLPVTAQTNVNYLCVENPAMNSATVAYQDTCSCDPNLKLAYFPQNCGTPAEVLDQPIEYMIQFSNIGQTQAYDILIEDQLDANLDWSTFQWLGSSHPYSQLTLSAGLLEVLFNNINLAPGAAGWIKFSVKPNATTPNNTIISNSADITFDSNAPVSTNVATTPIVFSSAQADLQLNALEFCVGDKMLIDYLWSGDAAWLNYSQNGVPIAQNVPAPPSGNQTSFVIPDASYVGSWDYELVAIDSITGCTDTARVVIVIKDCRCDLDTEIFMDAGEELYSFTSNLFDPDLNPGINILEFYWDLGDGTMSTASNPLHRYDCRNIRSRTVKVCLYYLVEIDGKICEATICQFFDICLDGPRSRGQAHIYPNPARNFVSIQSESWKGMVEFLTVEVYTGSGTLLGQHQIRPEYDRLNLNLQQEYQGLVFIRVLDAAGTVLAEERFIKIDD